MSLENFVEPELLHYAENFTFSNIHSANIAIVGRRDTGKTTILEQLALKLAENNFVAVFDSAAQHIEKSLIRKLHQYPQLQSKFAFFDVSFFLELSIEQDSMSAKNFFRSIYRRMTTSLLSNLNESGLPCFLIFDEIEFEAETFAQIQSLNERGIFFLAAVHDESSLYDTRRTKMLNLDCARLSLNLNLPKKAKILCGNCCVETAASIFYNKHCRIAAPMIWCAGLAAELEIAGIPTRLFCHGSKLFEDFNANPRDTFEGFSSIRKYLSLGHGIEDRPLDANQLRAELSENLAGIYCVDSGTFNSDDTLSGGHFVLTYRDFTGRIVILNPKRTVVSVIRDYPLEKFVRACRLNGSWRILLGKLAKSS